MNTFFYDHYTFSIHRIGEKVKLISETTLRRSWYIHVLSIAQKLEMIHNTKDFTYATVESTTTTYLDSLTIFSFQSVSHFGERWHSFPASLEFTGSRDSVTTALHTHQRGDDLNKSLYFCEQMKRFGYWLWCRMKKDKYRFW